MSDNNNQTSSESDALNSIFKFLKDISEQITGIHDRIDSISQRVSVVEEEKGLKVQEESVERTPAAYVHNRRSTLFTASEAPHQLVSHLVHSDPQISNEDKMRTLSARAWMVTKKAI